MRSLFFCFFFLFFYKFDLLFVFEMAFKSKLSVRVVGARG